MDPRRRTDPDTPAETRADETASPETPVETQDWDAIASGEIVPGSVPQNGDIRYRTDASDMPLGEDDDNPYQNSDEALPDDDEETALARDQSREGDRPDET